MALPFLLLGFILLIFFSYRSSFLKFSFDSEVFFLTFCWLLEITDPALWEGAMTCHTPPSLLSLAGDQGGQEKLVPLWKLQVSPKATQPSPPSLSQKEFWGLHTHLFHIMPGKVELGVKQIWPLLIFKNIIYWSLAFSSIWLIPKCCFVFFSF